MNKIRIIIAIGVICLITSCATSYKLDRTIWYNTSLVEKDGTKAIMTTSLYFFPSGTIDVYNSVRMDTLMIVEPFKYATGIYSVSGNPKSEAKIKIEAVTIDNKNIIYNGAYHKSDAMYLVSSDSITKVYGKLKGVFLP